MIADIDISNVEGVLFLFFTFLAGILWKYFLPFWRKVIVSQFLLRHNKLMELRKKEELSVEEMKEFVRIVKDALNF